MKVLGLITEYNPFHNGHLYHLNQSKGLSGADFVICVMSGNFIQRGEPALVNKWARTRMALLAGVDLVLELPLAFAMASAEFFGFGAVKILDSLGIVDTLCFGSENGRIDELDRIADLLVREPEEYKVLLKTFLSRGVSYPSARESALREYLCLQGSTQGDIAALTGSSNNILGIEYLKAIKKLNSPIRPLTIPRVANNYNQGELTGSISSATAIRSYLSSRQMDETVKATLPQTSLSVLEEEFRNHRGPVFAQNYENILLSLIRRKTAEELASYPHISEGLENRIIEAAESTGSFDELLDSICTKRYTRTRIQRALFTLMTGLLQKELDTFMEYGGPQYVRVLGFNQNGRTLLSAINRSCSLPVIVKTADFKRSCNPLLRRMLELEAAATDMYVLGYQNPAFRKGGQEFTQNVVRI